MNLRENIPPKSAASFREALVRLAPQLGLPGDSLSVSLLSFARFFSLPLEGALLAALRREALSGGAPPQAGAPGGGKKARPSAGTEETALAAAAAFSKGFGLSDEALAEYAAAIGGSWDTGGGSRRDRKREEEKRGREENGEKEGDGELGVWDREWGPDHLPEPVTHVSENAANPVFPIPHPPLPAPPYPQALSPGHIRALALENEAGSPLLGLLNKACGRDGRRWLVFPFTFPAGPDEFQVSVRILLSGEAGAGQKVERLAADIRCPRRRWLWSLEKPGEPSGEALAALDPALPGAEKLEGEIREALVSLAARVNIQNGSGEPPGEPLFSDCRNEALYPVNEEV